MADIPWKPLAIGALTTSFAYLPKVKTNHSDDGHIISAFMLAAFVSSDLKNKSFKGGVGLSHCIIHALWNPYGIASHSTFVSRGFVHGAEVPLQGYFKEEAFLRAPVITIYTDVDHVKSPLNMQARNLIFVNGWRCQLPHFWTCGQAEGGMQE